MSEGQVELVRRWVDFFNARDLDGFAAVCHPDFEKHSIFTAVEGGALFRGPEGFPRRYFETIDAAYERLVLEPVEFTDVGDAILMTTDATWRGRASGAEGTTRLFIVFWSREGKLTRDRTFTDRSAALAAMGSSSDVNSHRDPATLSE